LLDEVFVNWSEIQQSQNINNVMQIIANQENLIEAEDAAVTDENETEMPQLKGDAEVEKDISNEESETNCESNSNDSER